MFLSVRIHEINVTLIYRTIISFNKNAHFEMNLHYWYQIYDNSFSNINHWNAVGS